jgi:hypothetical protein
MAVENGIQIGVARFFLKQHTKTGKIYQMAIKIPNGNKNTKWQ